jgi:hypothetical protein
MVSNVSNTVTIVIPNWNGERFLPRLMKCLAAQTHPIREILVIDNGSGDRSIEISACAGARVLPLGANTGFARAANEGIRTCRTEWIALVNNDVELEPDWLAALVAAAQSGDYWFAAGKLLNARSREFVDGTYDEVSRGGCAWRCGQARRDGSIWSQKKEVRFVPFTAALFRTGLFERVGLLDEEFETHLEDVDFGMRCAMNGLPGVYVPQAVGYHEGSATLGRWHPDTVRRMARNQLLLIAKHYPANWVFRYGWPVFVAQALWGLVAVRHGAGLAYLQGKLQGLNALLRRGRKRPSPQGNLARLLQQSELEIKQLQQRTGFDWYWKLYFALT